jgi:nucleotidyltransferase AbiEii toxin of type IV toxin-antitoxin system
MAESYFALSSTDRKEALAVAASKSGRPIHILEKDVWVVWTLSALFRSPFAQHLIFKGGTSLSKVYRAIDRFSEDIDVTYDIRSIASDLVKDAGPDALPTSRSQATKWREIIEQRLAKWLSNEVLPYIQGCLEADKLAAKLRIEKGESIYIEYEAQVSGYGYVGPYIKIEFGGRSTGEPTVNVSVSCDAAEHLSEVTFPNADVRVMRVERTAWEKMTAIHVFCLQGNIKDQLARHWSDIVRLDAAGHIETAINAREIAQRVADHKSIFFIEKDAQGNRIDYFSAINGGLVLVPQGEVLKLLEADYGKMVEGRLFLRDPERFKLIVERCADIQKRANAVGVATNVEKAKQ